VPNPTLSGCCTHPQAALQDHISRKYQLGTCHQPLPSQRPVSCVFWPAPWGLLLSTSTWLQAITNLCHAVPDQGADMTLAQHLGLIPRPPALLSEAEWDEVHLKARLRQHSTTECPICQEDFGQDAQVVTY
jgi:hypothetical protein